LKAELTEIKCTIAGYGEGAKKFRLPIFHSPIKVIVIKKYILPIIAPLHDMAGAVGGNDFGYSRHISLLTYLKQPCPDSVIRA